MDKIGAYIIFIHKTEVILKKGCKMKMVNTHFYNFPLFYMHNEIGDTYGLYLNAANFQ